MQPITSPLKIAAPESSEPFELVDGKTWRAIEVPDANNERTHIRLTIDRLRERKAEIQVAMSKLDLEFRKIDDQERVLSECEKTLSGIIREE